MTVEFKKTGATSGELSFVTPKPPQEVFEYLADFQKHSEWVGEIVSLNRTADGPIAAGTTFATLESIRPGSRMQTTTGCEITTLEPPRLIEWKAWTAAKRGPMAMRSRWAFIIEPEGTGSRVTQRFSFDPPDMFGAMFLRIFVPIADGLMGGAGASPKNIRKHGEKLAEILGVRTSPPASDVAPASTA